MAPGAYPYTRIDLWRRGTKRAGFGRFDIVAFLVLGMEAVTALAWLAEDSGDIHLSAVVGGEIGYCGAHCVGSLDDANPNRRDGSGVELEWGSTLEPVWKSRVTA